ncbi:snoaL-like domain protein [Mycobacterium kansasii 732]|nr:snoaL-like domain protein [Mycobacterium kansasii 732]
MTPAESLAPADRLALSDLVHRYAAHVDDSEFDAAADLFTAAAELTTPDPPPH